MTMPKTQSAIFMSCLIVSAVCILRPALVAAEVSSVQPTATEKSPSEPNDGTVAAVGTESAEPTPEAPAISPAPASATATEPTEIDDAGDSQTEATPAAPSQAASEQDDEAGQEQIEASQSAAVQPDAAALETPQDELESVDADELLSNIRTSPTVSWSLVSLGVR